jgi:hypothetical protein
MKTFDEIRPELPPAQIRLIDSLLSKGLWYSGSAMKDGDRHLELKSEGNEIVINPTTGKIELFTEFLDPSDPADLGHHVWMIDSDATAAEVAAVVSAITDITGDN